MGHDESFKELKKIDNFSLSPAFIAQTILAERRLIKCAGEFYEYRDGVYVRIDEDVIRKWIKTHAGFDKFKRNLAEEAIYALGVDAFTGPETMNATDLLNLKNGLFDTDAYELKAHTPDVVSSIRLNVSYDQNARCDLWLKTIDEIMGSDPAKVQTIQEFFGLCLTKATKLERALFLLGDGANGKSTILYVLENLIGDVNRSAISISSLSNPHYVANLFNKLVNISSEVNVKSEVHDETFKKIVSGDSLTADRKYGQEFTFRPYCKMIFALNNMPRVDDKTMAFFRRLLIVRFEKTFTDAVANKNLKYDLLAELDGIFLWCLAGLKALRARGSFEINEKMSSEIREYQRENNNVILFVEEECDLGAEYSCLKSVLYSAYVAWCRNSGHRPVSTKKFGMELIKQHNGVTDGGRTPDGKSHLWDGIDLTVNVQKSQNG